MKLSVHDKKSCLVVSINGFFDKQAIAQTATEFYYYLSQNRDLVLDVSKLSGLDYAAIRFIGQIYKLHLNEGYELVIVGIKNQPALVSGLTQYCLWISKYEHMDAYLSRGDHTSKYFQSVY